MWRRALQHPTTGWSATRTTLVYVLVGVVWIVGSTLLAFGDGGLLGLSPRAAELIKGLLFIGVTGSALWVVTHRFERSLRASEARRRELLELNLTIAGEERARLVRSVQDDTIQLLAAAGLRLDSASSPERTSGVEQARALLRDGISSLRRSILELEPPELTPTTVEQLISAYAAHVLRPIEVDWEVEISLPPHLDAGLLTIVHRVLVEALSQAAKHETADHVSVVASTEADDIVGRVVVSGSGTAPTTPDDTDQLGLRAMRDGVARLGGTISTRGDDTGGTVVSFSLPIDPSTSRQV